MGIENRDYLRDENNQHGAAGFMPEFPGVRNIIVITVVVYLLQIFATRPVNVSDFSESSGSDPSTINQIDERYLQQIRGQVSNVSIVQNGSNWTQGKLSIAGKFGAC